MDWSLDWSTVFAGLLVVVTFGLYWVARQQTELTRQQLQLARQQMHDTRVLQRAYVGALPGGVSTTTHGELLAHVELKNVGHLPASQVRSVLKVLMNCTTVLLAGSRTYGAATMYSRAIT